ncbi:hypothetical protein OUZ56_027115 [Daphnia magna]|uniref:Uncharacterized protein n=1 Tax=Daphnia magna TaxID=35525 RepID=A0ABQ9ZNS8_9CRUS|nr:hypothetical protein OUZ56_027115 [Daphnia magna]
MKTASNDKRAFLGTQETHSLLALVLKQFSPMTWDSAGKKPMAIFSLAYCSKCNHVFSRSTFELTMKLSYDHTLLYQSRNNDEVSSKKAGLNQDFLELNLDLVGCVTEDNNFHVLLNYYMAFSWLPLMILSASKLAIA